MYTWTTPPSFFSRRHAIAPTQMSLQYAGQKQKRTKMSEKFPDVDDGLEVHQIYWVLSIVNVKIHTYKGTFTCLCLQLFSIEHVYSALYLIFSFSIRALTEKSKELWNKIQKNDTILNYVQSIKKEESIQSKLSCTQHPIKGTSNTFF